MLISLRLASDSLEVGDVWQYARMGVLRDIETKL